MADERIEFLFGPDIDLDDSDLDSFDVRSELLQRSYDVELDELELATLVIVANQILDDDPPEAWATVQRMRQLNLDRESILSQLVLAFAPTLEAALDGDADRDPAAYTEALARLPLPSALEVEEAMTEVVRRSPGISTEATVEAALQQLGGRTDDAVVTSLIDKSLEQLIGRHGPLAFAAGDRLVHVGDLTAGIVLTHVVTAVSQVKGPVGILDAAFDLSGFERREHLRRQPDDDSPMSAIQTGRYGWIGPEGWLDEYPAGTVLAVSVDDDGVVDIDVLDEAPACDEDLVARLRDGYDRSVEEPWLPVEGEELVLGVLLEDPQAFHEPAAPLSELAAAAGLEVRGTQVAHDETVWHTDVRSRRMWRVFRNFDEEDLDSANRVLFALDVADLLSGVDPAAVPDIDGPVGTAQVREVLAYLHDHDVLDVVIEEIYDSGEPNGQARAQMFTDALLAAASTPRDVALVRLMAAIGAEKDLEVAVAEQHLELAHEADPGFAPVIDRLAWYASDRGDAAKALRLWRQLDPTPALAQDIAEVERFAQPAHSALGRNEPCWCGSGRKFKQCHLGAIETAPLPDRIGWLCRKAVAFVERLGGEAESDILDVAEARAGDPEDRAAMIAAFAEPIVMDLVLTEGGWFEIFLEERGALLPDDEAMLAASWVLVDRSVYEVLEVRPGQGLDVRDLRTGDRLSVRERTFSREVPAGALVCGRAVPDGESNQFVGGLFPVRPGHEKSVLDLLDEGDPVEIASWVCDLYRPPTLQTREGEPLVACELVVDVGDEEAAREFLDATYEIDEDDGRDAWLEMFPLNEDERVLRARIRLEGTRLVVSTTSEARLERVLTTIHSALAGAVVVSDERTPIDMASAPPPRQADDADPFADDPEAAEALLEIRDRLEVRWCDESVPALDGLTPREAADDPTRREQLVRLIASFETRIVPGPTAMRPQRLRELLGL